MADSTYEYDGGGWVVKLRDDRIRRPGHPEDEPFSRLVVEHPGAAIILALDERRPGASACGSTGTRSASGWSSSRPGCCDVDGEEPLGVARRELVEEAGLEATEWTHLISSYSSPGISAETAHYFLARGLTEVGRGDFEPQHEEAEMEIGWVPFAELHEAVLAGRLGDAHLALAVLLAGSRLAPSQRRGADH